MRIMSITHRMRLFPYMMVKRSLLSLNSTINVIHIDLHVPKSEYVKNAPALRPCFGSLEI